MRSGHFDALTAQPLVEPVAVVGAVAHKVLALGLADRFAATFGRAEAGVDEALRLVECALAAKLIGQSDQNAARDLLSAP